MPVLKLAVFTVFLGLSTLFPTIWLLDWPANAASQTNVNLTVNSRLSTASSPYLRLHAGDKVKWYTWGDEAFAQATKLKRPLLVSFGYTACHWCHVMQETHFNVSNIAAAINENFIPVLVDRERRPELDETYMLVTEALTQRGGWPNTVFLTPRLKPFYGTGYIPPTDFTRLLTAVVDGWANGRSELVGEAERLSKLLQRYLTRREKAREISPQLITKAARDLAGQFDSFSGGLGRGPKFFQPTVLMFLLQQAERNNDPATLTAIETTLQAITSGGIHDQIEGGLHRYAIDPAWRVPHFEKMLYDQAAMTAVYAQAYRITGKVEFGRMAAKIADYVLQDLHNPDGGFYSTRDADSQGEEGTYYVWSKAQLISALGPEEAAYAIQVFETVTEGELAGKIILNRDQIGNQTVPRIERILARLAEVRSKRIKPQRDEKLVVSWNGLMISALAQSSLILGSEKFELAALKAGQFIWDKLRDDKGNLKRSFFSGTAEIDAELVDYAFLARAYIDLYDLSQQKIWLIRAKTLLQTMETQFGDPKEGDFYSSQGTIGFGRLKSRQDSDMASGNGTALDVLISLTNRDGGAELVRRSEKLITALSGIAVKSPVNGASVLLATDRFLHGQSGPVQYGGGGTVRAQAVFLTKSSRGGRDSLAIRFKITKGWHINAHKPLEDYLIATNLSLMTKGKQQSAVVSYPKPQIKQLGFSENPLALLEDQFEIKIVPKPGTPVPYDIHLEIQACSDRICLNPDLLKFRVSPPLISD